jgi:general secretion pathway protein D
MNGRIHSQRAFRQAAVLLGLLLLISAGATIRAQEPSPAASPEAAADQAATTATVTPEPTPTPTPTPTPDPEDLTSTMTLQLKNQGIDPLVKFLGETTGKPVIYDQKDVGSVQITVSSPKPVTRGKALEYIYDALLMQGIYIVELEDQIRIVKAEAIKGMQFQSIEADQDLQAMADSNRMMQKIYKLRDISAENLKKHLEKLVPESAMTIDESGNTIIIVDQISRLKRYDRIVRALDRPDDGDRVVEFFTLDYTDAPLMAELLLAVIAQREGGENQNENQNQNRSRSSRGGASGGRAQFQIGDIAIVPDARLNLLVVACPRSRLAEITRLIDELDQPKPPDIQMRTIRVRYVDTSRLARSLTQLFPTSGRQSDKELIQIVPYSDGDQIIVRSSAVNFELVKALVEEIDVEEAEQRETRTYKIEHLQVKDLAEQLNNLFEQTYSTSYQSDGWGYSYRSSYRGEGQPVFVPISRNNSLVVMAKARDFDFIKKMIDELDKPVDMKALEPQIFQIRNTDANELVKIMETLFTGEQSSAANVFSRWRPDDGDDAVKELFGDIRFVVDTVTNRVVVLSSRPENYPLVKAMIEKIDRFDPESSEVLLYELKYADPLDVAERLNALFSEGAVQQQDRQGRQQNEEDDDDSQTAETLRQIFFPWQSGGRERREGEEERPINTMIGNVRVVPDVRSSALLVAAPPIYFPTLRDVIDKLDRPEPQVNIRTRTLEITRGAERRIGIRWTPDPNSIEPAELDNAIVGLAQLGFLDAFGNGDTGPTGVGASQAFGGISRTLDTATGAGSSILAGDVNIALLVQLLLKNSNSRVLLDPNLTVNNNETGNLFFGSEFPFRSGSFTQDTGARQENIEYKPIGVTLDITPHINFNGEIVLAVNLENSSIRDERISGDLVTDKTRLKTEVVVDSGQTMVIGGIIIEDEFSTQREVPILGRIPLLGWFFRKSDGAKSIRELMVFITPDVLNTRQDDDALLQRSRHLMDEIENGHRD